MDDCQHSTGTICPFPTASKCLDETTQRQARATNALRPRLTAQCPCITHPAPITSLQCGLWRHGSIRVFCHEKRRKVSKTREGRVIAIQHRLIGLADGGQRPPRGGAQPHFWWEGSLDSGACTGHHRLSNAAGLANAVNETKPRQRLTTHQKEREQDVIEG